MTYPNFKELWLLMTQKYHQFSILIMLGLSLVSCSPTQYVRGNFFEMDELKKIELNKTKKSDLLELFGPPSSQELFGGDVWYYIGDKVEKKAFFDPKILEREILAITFGPDGTVTSYEIKDLSHHYDVEVKAEATPVKGRDPSLVSELFGNIGRYSAPKKTASR
jgi:outer membrane protein assembly factor BamE (lipoprotein component of BamABCDE complex)